MKLKAQNTIEVISLVVIVTIVVVSVFMFSKGNNANLANLSKGNSSLNSSYSEEINSSSNVQINQNRIDVETAGALSGKVASMTESELLDALSEKTVSDLFSVKSATNEDIFDLANKLIQDLNLAVSPFEKADLSDSVKQSLVKVAVDAKSRLGANPSETYVMYTAVLAKIIL